MRVLAVLVLPVVASVLLASCGDPAADLRSRREKAELEQLRQVKEVLSTGDALDTDFQVFLSRGLLDSALQQIGSVKVPIKELDDAVLTISDVKTAFTNGYPAVSLKLDVTSAKRNISAVALASAEMFLDVSPQDISSSTFRIVLKDIQPSARIWFWQTSLSGFWKDVATLVGQQKLAALPTFSVPLSATAPFSLGGASSVTIPTGNGSAVSGTLTVPALAGSATLGIKHVLFLEDGVHLYLASEVQ